MSAFFYRNSHRSTPALILALLPELLFPFFQWNHVLTFQKSFFVRFCFKFIIAASFLTQLVTVLCSGCSLLCVSYLSPGDYSFLLNFIECWKAFLASLPLYMTYKKACSTQCKPFLFDIFQSKKVALEKLRFAFALKYIRKTSYIVMRPCGSIRDAF